MPSSIENICCFLKTRKCARKIFIVFATLNDLIKTSNRAETSGVFKRRRARHLPRPPLFGGPPWGVTRVNFLYFWWKIYYSLIQCTTKQIICKYSAFKGAGTLLSQGPQQQLQFEVNLLSKGPQQPLKCVSRPTLLLNFIEGSLKKLQM